MSTKKEKNRPKPSAKGPSMGYSDNFPKRQFWEEIAKDFQGEFKIKHDKGNEVEIHNITIPHNKWKIHISVSDNRPLKFEISFQSSQAFELTLSWEDFIEKVLKKFGKPEIELGWKNFDDRYLIKSNRADLVKGVFTRAIQQTLLKHNVYSISYQTKEKMRTAELMSVIQRHVGEKEMIVDLIEMHKSLIDNFIKYRIIK